jgi:toxin ParE1/3/4
MSRSTISQTASRDLVEILDYFTNINIDAEERFIQEFEKKCKNMVNFPNMGRSYEDIAPF